MAKKIKSIEENMLDIYKKIRDKVIQQGQLGENMPKIIDNIINGDYIDSNIMKEDCKKLVDAI